MDSNGTKQNINDFGKKGWMLIILGILINFMNSGSMVEANNIIVPNMAERVGVSPASIYALSTPISFIGVAALFVIALIGRRVGAKKIALFSFIIVIISMILHAVCKTFMVYALAKTLLRIGGAGVVQIGYSSLIANWFPRKKDLAQGWATMGSNLATAGFLPIMLLMMTVIDFQMTFWVYALVWAILAVMILVFITQNPEESGYSPDNDKTITRADIDEMHRLEKEYQETSPWTVKKLLRTGKTWQIAIAMGIVMMITTGMLQTMVATLTMKGMTQERAVAMMSVAAIVGLAASYIWGYIGTKFSTKTACITVYGVVFLAIACMLLPVSWSAYGVVFFVGCFIGAGNNLCPALIQEVFGRYDYKNAITVIMPIWQLIVGQGGAIAGVPLSLTGSYVASYVFFAILAVIGLLLIIFMDTRLIGRNELTSDKSL